MAQGRRGKSHRGVKPEAKNKKLKPWGFYVLPEV